MIVLRNNENKQSQEIFSWIEGYNGNFDFILSLKTQLLVKGYLSDKQISAAERCMKKDKPTLPKGPNLSLKPGQVLEVTKGFAKKIAEKNSSSATFFNFEVIEVLAETAKALLIKTKASAKVTSHCCVCGRELTDPASIMSGIGPICAENNNLPHGDVDLTKAMLEEMASKEVQLETWIPKSAIKNFVFLKNNS